MTSLSIEIKDPVVYLFEREGLWNWNAAFPASESNEVEPISGSPVEIEEAFIRIENPRFVINREEPLTLEALEISGELHKDFDAQLSLKFEDALIHSGQQKHPLQLFLNTKLSPDSLESSIQMSSDINLNTDISISNYLEDMQFDVKSTLLIPPTALQRFIEQPIKSIY